MNIWHELEIAATTDLRSIKRAYSAKLKLTQPEDDPDGFQRLRAAYEQALANAQYSQSSATPSKTLFTHSSDIEVSSRSTNQQSTHNTENSEHEAGHEEKTDATLHDKYISLMESRITAIDAVLRKGNQSTATKILESMLHDEEFDNLDNRDKLEINVLNFLQHIKSFPYNFAFSASMLFGWEQLERQNNPFVDYHNNPVINQIRARRECIKLKKNIDFFSYKGIAFGNVLGKYRPRLFKWRAMRKKVKYATLEFISQLQNANPEILHYEVDHRNVAWWRQAATQPHYGWTTFIMAYFISLGLVTMMLTNENYQSASEYGIKKIIFFAFIGVCLLWYGLIKIWHSIKKAITLISNTLNTNNLFMTLYVLVIIGLLVGANIHGQVAIQLLALIGFVLLASFLFRLSGMLWVSLFSAVLAGLLLAYKHQYTFFADKTYIYTWLLSIACFTLVAWCSKFFNLAIVDKIKSLLIKQERGIADWCSIFLAPGPIKTVKFVFVIVVLIFSISTFEKFDKPDVGVKQVNNAAIIERTKTRKKPEKPSNDKEKDLPFSFDYAIGNPMVFKSNDEITTRYLAARGVKQNKQKSIDKYTLKSIPGSDKDNNILSSFDFKIGKPMDFKSNEELAIKYWTGRGVTQNKQKAIDMLALEARLGSDTAKDKIEELYINEMRKKLFGYDKEGKITDLDFPISTSYGMSHIDFDGWDERLKKRLK